MNGPYEPGLWNDIMIFRNSLMSYLGVGERVEADDGYVGEAPRHVKCPASVTNDPKKLEMQQRVRNRQETLNKRFKHWKILAERFRHDIQDHGDVFRAIAVISQLTIESGEKLFDVEYDDDL